MNKEAKKAISDRFRIACEREKLNYSQAARLLDFDSQYGCKISNEKQWDKCPLSVWLIVKRWTNSGKTLRQYGAKQGNSESPKKETVPYRPDQKPDDPMNLSSKKIPEDEPLSESTKKKIQDSKSFPDAMTSQIFHQKIPYCCPVCGGNGLVPHGFYNQTGGQWITSSFSPETCRSCNGTGIVWG